MNLQTFIVLHSLASNNSTIQGVDAKLVHKARCRDKANLKNGKLKSTSGKSYEPGTELEFDCKVCLLKKYKALEYAVVKYLQYYTFHPY